MQIALIAIGVIVASMFAVLALAAAKPETISLAHTVDINAAPERIFPFIDDLRRWPEWPADAEQAQATRTFGPISRGRGATSEWSGSGSAGVGRMEITESSPSSRVVVAVDFRKPFAAHNVNEFTLERRGSGTRVTWSWHGQNVFVLRVMTVFVSAETMMGSHFESALQALKRKAES